MARGAAPIIGVTTYREEATWGPWRTTAALVPDSYVECVARAGGRPVLLPVTVGPGSGDGAAVEAAAVEVAAVEVAAVEVVAALDALVLVGGGDLDPASYGAAAHAATGGVSRHRDDAEAALLAAALAAGVPVLAICRGLQVLNVHRGGTLVQHLPELVGHTGHRPAAGCFGPTEVRIEPGSCLAKIMGESDTVSCSHHQAVDEVGSGLVVTARAPDGVVEAVEMPAASFVVGVQWHPEEERDVRLFEALVDATG